MKDYVGGKPGLYVIFLGNTVIMQWTLSVANSQGTEKLVGGRKSSR